MPVMNPKPETKYTRWQLPPSFPQPIEFEIYVGPPKAPLPGWQRPRRPMTASELEDADGHVDADARSQYARSETIAVRLTPGEEIELPSEYDRAIQQVDDRGLVVGGHAPMLRRLTGRAADLHPAIRDSLLATPEPQPVGTSLDEVLAKLGDRKQHVDDEEADPIETAKVRRIK